MNDILVPKFGMSGTEIEVIEVLVEVGDVVAPGDAVVEAASDKVDFSIESEHAGVVDAILCAAGDTVAMGSRIIRLRDNL